MSHFFLSNSIFRKDGIAQGVAKQRLIETLAKPDKRIIVEMEPLSLLDQTERSAALRRLTKTLYALAATFGPKLYTYYYMAIEPYRC